MLTVGSCFSGIGGIELGLEWTGGFEAKWQIEMDAYASKVLEKHWPHVKRYRDIRKIDTDELARVDLICGGYPCQPFSYAGKRQGVSDSRHLWPDMVRIIRHLRPRFVLLENVPGHLSMGFGRVLGDLAECGYDAEWQVLSAAGVGAPHLRKRVFILAYPQGDGMEGCQTEFKEPREGEEIRRVERSGEAVADTSSERLERGERSEPQGGGIGFTPSSWWATEPNVGFRTDGLSPKLDGGGLGADAKERRSHSLLQSVWDAIGKKKVQGDVGGSERISQTIVLRPEVYEQSVCQRHAILIGLAKKSYQIPWEELRIVWGYDEHSRSPYRRELAERLARKYPDLVRELSYFPPPPCSSCWEDGSWEAGIERVGVKISKRVDRLKCLGNAVVPQVAQKIGEMILNNEIL